MTVLCEAWDLSGALLVLGGIVVAFTIGRMMARRGGVPPDPGAGSGARADEQIERIEEAGGRVLQEIEALGRETLARAETRMRVLNELLLRAERASPASAGDDGGGASGRFDEVYRLDGEGVDRNQIAERTGFERGEIDVILSLRKSSRPGGSARTETSPP